MNKRQVRPARRDGPPGAAGRQTPSSSPSDRARAISSLRALSDAAGQLGGAPDVREIFQAAARLLVDRFGACRSEVWALEKGAGALELEAEARLPGPLPEVDRPPAAGAVAALGQVAESQTTRAFDLTRADCPLRLASAPGDAPHHAIAAPVVANGQVRAVLVYYDDYPPDAVLLAAVEAHAAIIGSAIQSVDRQLGQQRELQEARLSVQARGSEARFQGLLESAPDAIVITSGDGLIRLVNRQTEQLFGYPREDLLGQPVEMLVPERSRRGHVAQRSGYARQPRTRPMGAGLELYGQRRDGSMVPVEISLSPMETEDGLLIISVIRDVTERRRSDEHLREVATVLARQSVELVRSNEELQQFAYVASHDLQEPLRMVASYTQLLKRRYAGNLDADADEFIDYAVDGATRMQRLINDLLIYSRLGTRGKEFAPVDTDAVLAEVLADLAAAIEEGGAAVTHDPLPTVQGDPSQLGQLFLNLVANAIKFRGEAAPRVHVSARREGAEWLFSVRDNGIGIAPEYTDRIFVIFQRLHNRTEYPGTGIGLAICKKIVERHGGRIWLESQPGQGATFFFTLPAAAEEQA